VSVAVRRFPVSFGSAFPLFARLSYARVPCIHFYFRGSGQLNNAPVESRTPRIHIACR
jgi:hypothetical protein